MLITNGAVAFYFKLNTMTTNGSGLNEVFCLAQMFVSRQNVRRQKILFKPLLPVCIFFNNFLSGEEKSLIFIFLKCL